MAYDDRFAKRLSGAVLASKKALKPFRQFRVDTLRLAAGAHYGNTTVSRRRPANQISAGLDVYTRLLVGRTPAVGITSPVAENRATAFYFQERMNALLHELKYGALVSEVLTDALVLWGITKRGLAKDEDHVWEYESARTEIDLTRPFVHRVSPDDFVIDMSAKTRDAAQFMGDVVEIDRDFVLNSGLYENVEQVREKWADATGAKDEAAGAMSKTRSVEQDLLFQKVRLLEVYIPRDNTVVTLPVEGGRIMRVQEFDGGEQGPYNILSFRDLPDNVVPFAPAMDWVDLDKAVNLLMRKFINQAVRSKVLPVGRKGAKKDAVAIRNASDGEIVLLDSPESLKEARFGGVDQQNWAFTLWMLNHLNVVQGNPEALAGLGVVSDTARQEQQVLQRAGLRVDDMRLQLEKFVERDVRMLAWYEWTEPIRERPVTLVVKGAGEIRSVFSPWVREGDFLDYSFKIVPYSMVPDKPAEQAEKLKRLMVEIALPLQQLLQGSGKTIDAARLLEIIGEKERIDGLDEVVIDAPQQQGQGQVQPQKPPITSREYIRKSVAGGSPSAVNQGLMQTLLGGAA